MAFTIGQTAKESGVNVQTVRFYERRNLIAPLSRRESGYRIFGPETVSRIRFIKNAQALGFTLKEIEQLLRLRVTKTSRCGDVKKKAEVKLRDVKAKIASLKALEKVLADLIKACQMKATTDHCPILNSLGIQRGNERFLKGIKK